MEQMEISAGILPFRRHGELEVLLAHPGRALLGKEGRGRLDDPEGAGRSGEELLAAALREFTEETGLRRAGPFVPLAPVKQKSGKVVHAFACAGDFDPDTLCVQHVRHRVAAQVGQAQELSRDRSGGMVRHGCGAREDTDVSAAVAG